MSWLSDIAGKAENFLNAMDKSAASAIEQASNVVANTNLTAITSPSGSSSRRHSRKHSMKSDLDANDSMMHFDTEFIETPDIMSLKTSASTNSLYSTNGNGNGSTPYSKGHQRNSSFGSVGSRDSQQNKKELDDDRLMEFLNAKERNIPEEEWRPLDGSTASVSVIDETMESQSQQSHDSDHSDASFTAKQSRLNQVKVDALSKELAGLQKRYADLVAEYKAMQKKAITYHNQNSGNEKAIKELRSREGDLMASIQAKDSQIAALRVQMEQYDSELAQKHSALLALEEANASLRTLAETKPALDQELVANLEAEISSLKQSLKEERDQLKRMQESHREQVNRLEDNQRSLIDEIEAARRGVVEAKKAKAEAELTSGAAIKRAESLEKELAEFRLKANKTLADKDEMIRVLQGGNKEDLETQQSAGGVSQGDRIRVLQEQSESLATELAELQSKYDNIKLSLDKAENETIPRAEYEIRSLRDQLTSEQSISANLKNDVRQLTEESKQYADDLNQIRTSLSARIQERDEEIEKLRKQLVMKQQRGVVQLNATTEGTSSTITGPTAASADEWEQRLRTLTENLIQKQATVEQLSSANHSLKLQLERSEQRLREMASSGASLSNDVAIGIYHSPTFTNYIKHRMTSNTSDSMTSLLEDNPNDGNVTRRVKRAYGAVDAFSIRLGNFLRVYPSARAAFLVYIIILHLWVIFVFIYFEPEVHAPDFHHSPKGLK